MTVDLMLFGFHGIRHNLTIRHPNKNLRANFGLKSVKDGFQDTVIAHDKASLKMEQKFFSFNIYYLNSHFSDIVVFIEL